MESGGSDALDERPHGRRRRDTDRVREDDLVRLELRGQLHDCLWIDRALERAAEGDADRRGRRTIGLREDPLHALRGLRERRIPVAPVEGVRRAERDVDAVEVGLPEPLVALLVENQPCVLDAVAALDAGNHLLGASHLRHAVVADEADRLDPRQAGLGEPVDQIGANRRRQGVALVLEPVARADVGDDQRHLETVRADVLDADSHEQSLLSRPRRPALPRVLAGHPVDVLVRTLGRHLGAAAHGDPAVAVAAVDDEHTDARVARDVPRLDASRGRVEDDALTVPVDPDDAQLRGAVRVRRGDGREVRLFEKEGLLGGEPRHAVTRPDLRSPPSPA